MTKQRISVGSNDLSSILNGTYIHGDCMDYLPLFPDNHFDLLFADVDFGIGEDGRKSYKSWVKQKNGTRLPIKTMISDERWDNKQPSQAYFDEIFRVSKYHIIMGSNYLNFDQKSQSTGRIFWDKVNGNSDQSSGELFWTNLFSRIVQFEFLWQGHRQGVSISNGRAQRGNKKLNEKKIQRCQKPIMLYQWMLQQFALLGWKILDTHVGSASSLIACELEGFEYTGYERLESHYTNSRKRLIQEVMNIPERLEKSANEVREQLNLF